MAMTVAAALAVIVAMTAAVSLCQTEHPLYRPRRCCRCSNISNDERL
jgi:hypothetical protein